MEDEELMDASEAFKEAKAETTVPKRLQGLYDLLKRSGFDVDNIPDFSKLKNVNGGRWTTGMKVKQDDGTEAIEYAEQERSGWTWVPEIAPGWDPIRTGPTIKVPAISAKPHKPEGWETAVCLPDIQIGYWRDVHGTLIPTHDEAAIDVAHQLLKYIRPDQIINHGDNADFPELSRFRLSPVFAQTTQETIDRCTIEAIRQRALVAEGGRVVWLAGNHEERLPMYIVDNAKAMFGLRPGITAPDSWPVMSFPFLCRFDEVDVEFIPGYPTSEVWLNDQLRVSHGPNHGPAAAKKYLESQPVSTVFGHSHHSVRVDRTIPVRGGKLLQTAMSAGCLARTDGMVPSTKSGSDLNGQPIPHVEDWQQGIVVAHFKPTGEHRLQYVPIVDGVAWYMGKEFRATVTVDGDLL